MSIYWLMLAAIIILGFFMPQTGDRKKTYVILMAAMHIFISGFRYNHLVGDLMKYHAEYIDTGNYGYFSEEIVHGWRNTGFYWLMKLVSSVTGVDFQAFLIVLAVITGVIVAVFIYRYSARPWFSFVVYDCMAFYLTYNLCAIKQGLAMAILLCSMMCIFEKKPLRFLVFTLLAGFIHMPALCFLPAYFVANRKITGSTIVAYLIAAAAIFALRTQIVDEISELYYDDSFELVTMELGGRVAVIVLILLTGLVLKGFQEAQFEQLFNMIVVAAIFQMFSGFDNVFTRLADYYLQFAILFIPAIFYELPKSRKRKDGREALLPVTDGSMQLFIIIVTIILIWWYYQTCLGHDLSGSVDNYLDYRFMWQIK